jgi:molecular chaperone DnaK
VTFDVDADGLLNVSAKDQHSGQAQAIRITPSSGLSQTEIVRMVEEANRFAEEDRKRREETMLLNHLNGLLQNTRKSFEEFGWMLDDEEQQRVKDLFITSRHAIESRQIDELNRAVAEVEEVAARLKQLMLSPS